MSPLESIAVGSTVVVAQMDDPQTALSALRLGIAQGETLYLAAKIPGGPVVVRRGNIEIALGRELCRHILVETKPGEMKS
ncbi:MAG: ferrous iron transport protein A [Cyanobacteria bacterium]|nr:ferrous iron transport protein A [Cyanobacteriota bacterium]